MTAEALQASFGEYHRGMQSTANEAYRAQSTWASIEDRIPTLKDGPLEHAQTLVGMAFDEKTYSAGSIHRETRRMAFEQHPLDYGEDLAFNGRDGRQDNADSIATGNRRVERHQMLSAFRAGYQEMLKQQFHLYSEISEVASEADTVDDAIRLRYDSREKFEEAINPLVEKLELYISLREQLEPNKEPVRAKEYLRILQQESKRIFSK